MCIFVNVYFKNTRVYLSPTVLFLWRTLPRPSFSNLFGGITLQPCTEDSCLRALSNTLLPTNLSPCQSLLSPSSWMSPVPFGSALHPHCHHLRAGLHHPAGQHESIPSSSCLPSTLLTAPSSAPDNMNLVVSPLVSVLP